MRVSWLDPACEYARTVKAEIERGATLSKIIRKAREEQELARKKRAAVAVMTRERSVQALSQGPSTPVSVAPCIRVSVCLLVKVSRGREGWLRLRMQREAQDVNSALPLCCLDSTGSSASQSVASIQQSLVWGHPRVMLRYQKRSCGARAVLRTAAPVHPLISTASVFRVRAALLYPCPP